MEESTAGHETRFISVAVAGTDYGLPRAAVREILPYESPVEMPGMPISIRGIADVRGMAIPVIDLALKFGRAAIVPTSRTRLLVVETVIAGAPITLGLVVDDVNGEMELAADCIEPPPALGPKGGLDFLKGICRAGGSFLPLLRVDRVVSASESNLRAQSKVLRAAHDAKRAQTPFVLTTGKGSASTEMQ
jgi:purine-binding chemotaxis protein CheW